MRFLRYIIYILIALGIAAFSLINSQKVIIKIPFSTVEFSSYLFIFLLGFFILGILFALFLNSDEFIKSYLQKVKSLKEKKMLEEKINIYETELKIYENIRQNAKKLQINASSKLLQNLF